MKVLVTGADGYLGRRVARRFEEIAGAEVVRWGRANGDLEDAEPFAGVDPAEITHVVHGAAVVRFNVEEDLARRVNEQGTEKLLRFAERCPRLESVTLLSTVYACGLAEGAIEEVPFSGERGFANHYERSKWAAERAVQERFGHLPWKILRVATAIADDEQGRVTQYNAFHNTLRLLYYGLLSVVPGDAAVPLYFVTGEFVADAVVALSKARERGIFHLAHRREESLSLGELLDVAFEVFARDEDFARRRIGRPLFADREAFEVLSGALGTVGGQVVSQGLASVTPFAPQLFSPKRVGNARLRGALERYRAPDARGLIRATCERLVGTRWGLREEAAS